MVLLNMYWLPLSAMKHMYIQQSHSNIYLPGKYVIEIEME